MRIIQFRIETNLYIIIGILFIFLDNDECAFCRNTSRSDFKFYADRLIRLVIEESLNQLPYSDCSVVTPTGAIYDGLKYVCKLNARLENCLLPKNRRFYPLGISQAIAVCLLFVLARQWNKDYAIVVDQFALEKF